VHTLDTSGFELSAGLVSSDDFLDAYPDGLGLHSRIRDLVYPKVAEALRHKVKATKVIPFDHVFRRSEDLDALPPTSIAPPIRRVHNDYSLDSGYIRARMELAAFTSEDELDNALKERFAIINIWTPLHAVKCDPLAFIDFRTAAPIDVQVARSTFHTTAFPIRDTYRVYYNSDHRWIYFSDLGPHECIVFKTFDSSLDPSIAKMALHASCDLLGQDLQHARESLEIRCLVFFSQLSDDFGAGYSPPPGQAGQSGGDCILKPPEFLPREAAQRFDEDFIATHSLRGGVPESDMDELYD